MSPVLNQYVPPWHYRQPFEVMRFSEISNPDDWTVKDVTVWRRRIGTSGKWHRVYFLPSQQVVGSRGYRAHLRREMPMRGRTWKSPKH